MNYIKPYVDFLKKFIKPARPLRVVADCSDGTAGLVLKKLFAASRVRAKLVNARPDGRFPAHGPNPMAEGVLAGLKKTIISAKADLGVIFDADADRVFFVDDAGKEVPPDAAAALISKNFKGPVILDVRAGYLARELLAAPKKKIIETRVGHYFIKKLMVRHNVGFAAETSGHYYFAFPGGAYFDSAILAAIYMINAIAGLKEKRLSRWLAGLSCYYRSGELNYEVEDKVKAMTAVEEKYKKEARKISKLDGLKMEFEKWWFVLRPSNTENLLRLNLEAKSEKILKQMLRGISGLISG